MNLVITVRKELSDTDAEQFEFIVFDNFTLVFVRYYRYNKPKGKRKWEIVKYWDKYSQRDSTTVEPILTDEIKNDAIRNFTHMVTNKITVKTWTEWKDKS